MSSLRLMKIWIPILFLAGIVLLFVLPKQEAKLASPESCSCQKFPGDAYDQPRSYRFGSHAGRCIDSCTFRAPVLVGSSERGGAQTLELANVFHAGRFWKASVPLTSPPEVEVLFQKFTETFHHVSLRFQFSKKFPLLLTPQTPESLADGAKQVSVESLVVSPEGVPPAGEKYSLVDALLGRYVVSYRLSSYDDYRDVSERLGYPLRAFPLTLDADERQKLLRLAVDTSLQENFQSVYNLVFNNCATLSLDLALSAKKELQSRELWKTLDPLRGIPLERSLGTLRSFEWWHLIEPAQASAKEGDFSALRQWNGKHSFEMIGGRDFWSHPTLRAKLYDALGEKELRTFRNFADGGPSSPVTESQGYLFASACKIHECSSERFEVIIDLRKTRVFVCRASTESLAKNQTHWFTGKNQKAVSNQECSPTRGPEAKQSESFYRSSLDRIPKSLMSR